MTYTATVTREGDVWIAEVGGLEGAHTSARTLPLLRAHLQEVVGLVLDEPEGVEYDISLRFDESVDEIFREAASIGEHRHRLEEEQRELAQQTITAATRLSNAGWPVRDIAAALAVSPGRVSQVTRVA